MATIQEFIDSASAGFTTVAEQRNTDVAELRSRDDAIDSKAEQALLDLDQKASLSGDNVIPDEFRTALALDAVDRYMGEWNAATNTPAIAAGVGEEGQYYTVSVPGSTTINGVTDWVVGDEIRFDGSAWVKKRPMYRRKANAGTTVSRPAYLKMSDRVSFRDWLSPGDDNGVVPLADKLEQAINEVLQAGRGELCIEPAAQSYRIERPIVVTGQNPIKIIGTGPMSGFPLGNARQVDILYTGGAEYPGQAAITFQTNGGNGAPLRGVELHNLMIREPSNAMSGRSSGVHGLAFKGVTRAVLNNVSTYGFANGLDLDDNPANATGEMVRCANFMIYSFVAMNAAQDRASIKGSAEIFFYGATLHGTARAGGYRSDLHIGRGSRGGRADHIHVLGGVMTGGGVVTPEYNLHHESGIFNQCVGVAFEGAGEAGVFIGSDDLLRDSPSISLHNCSIDGMYKYAVDVLGARTNIYNLRTQQRIAAEGGTEAYPAVRIRGSATVPNSLVGSEIVGGVISTSGSTCIELENVAGVSIIGGSYRSRTSGNKPCITVKPSCSRIDIIAPKLLENTTVPLVQNTDTTQFGTNGISIRGSALARPLPVITGTLDASGQATPAHGVGNPAKIIEARAYAVTGAGPRVPLPIDYWDGAGVRLNGGAANAGRAFELYVTRIP